MPTSSQSKILSAVDYQLFQQQYQQQAINTQDATSKVHSVNSTYPTSTVESKKYLSKDNRRLSTGKNDGDNCVSLDLSNFNTCRQNFDQNDDGSIESPQRRQASLNERDKPDMEYRSKQIRSHRTLIGADDENSSSSDMENINSGEETLIHNQRSSILNEHARRLLVLGTIRPSKTFYKDLPEADVEHLMEYFRRMRKTDRRLTSEEINEELATRFVEYKPKIFFDSSHVTKTQVVNVERLIQQYADKIRANEAEIAKLENPLRFVIRQLDSDQLLTTLPHEYNDCLLTLVTRSDPLHKSVLVSELIPNRVLDDVKANSLDISYFPGGVNYDIPHDDIEDNGQMKLETYQKLKKRLNNRKVWYFSEAPEKRPNALLAIVPLGLPINMNHQRLLDCCNAHWKTLCLDKDVPIEERVLSIEYVALSCILSSYDIPNQFVIDCDSKETKDKFLEQPLRLISGQQIFIIELYSYDEYIHKEYEKSIKAQKYQELIKNHEVATKQTTSVK